MAGRCRRRSEWGEVGRHERCTSATSRTNTEGTDNTLQGPSARAHVQTRVPSVVRSLDLDTVRLWRQTLTQTHYIYYSKSTLHLHFLPGSVVSNLLVRCEDLQGNYCVMKCIPFWDVLGCSVGGWINQMIHLWKDHCRRPWSTCPWCQGYHSYTLYTETWVAVGLVSQLNLTIAGRFQVPDSREFYWVVSIIFNSERHWTHLKYMMVTVVITAFPTRK